MSASVKITGKNAKMFLAYSNNRAELRITDEVLHVRVVKAESYRIEVQPAEDGFSCTQWDEFARSIAYAMTEYHKATGYSAVHSVTLEVLY
jgi:hypothetical protein